MNRYAAIPWPLAGIVVAVVLVAIDLLVTSLGPNLALEQTVYRTAMWSIGIASLGLLLLPARRAAYFLGFLACAGLMAFALYLQYGLGLEPCPLCVFQRVAMIATGVVFLVAALHNPGRGGATFYAVLTLITAGIGAGLAAWQVWIQGQPKGSVPACGMGLDYMLDTLPLDRRHLARAEGQRRVRGARLAVPGPCDPVVDVRVLRRDDRGGVRADPPETSSTTACCFT